MKAEAPLTLTPGKQLSIARRAQGKSLTQISDATRILESRLEAIERDDYSAVGISPAFVVGYVKAFAGQVGVPPAPLIEVLNAYFKHRKATEEHDNPVNETPRVINWGLWLASVLALLVFLGLGQWYIVQQADGPPVMGSVELEAQEIDLVGLSRESDVVVQPITAKNAISSEAPELLDQPEAIRSTATSHSIIVNLAVEGGHTPSGFGEPKDIVANEAVISEPKKISDRLALVFSDECWLEVFDANGQRLLARLAKNQDVINLEGQAPFDIKLGNAHSVKVTVNDREVELTPSPNRRVLRIQVGP